MRIDWKCGARTWALGMLAFLIFGFVSVAGDLKQPMIGALVPAFVLKSLDGKTVSLQEQRGKFVVLHIAASW